MNKTLCTTCNKFITNNNFKKHFSSCHGIKIKKIRGIDYDPNHGYSSGTRSAWNKNLTAASDERIVAYAKSQEGKLVTGCFAMPKEKRSALAKEHNFGGYRENAGRSKKFKTIDSFGNNVCLQSSYELLCSDILNKLNIKWVRPKSLKYNNKNYFADFYLPDYDIYLDPKNKYKASLDKEKIDAVIDQNNVNVFVLLEEQITEDYIKNLIAA